VNASEFAAARRTLGASVEDIAVSLDLTPKIVAAFEDGSVAVPKDTAGEMAWRVATFVRLDALATSGIPECPWIVQWQNAPDPARSAAKVKRLNELTAHVATCPTCIAREQFILDRFGTMPDRPVTGWQGWLLAVMKLIDGLPAWMRPGVRVALLFLAYSAFKLVLLMPHVRSSEHPWPLVLQAFAISGALGFAVGTAYAGVKWLLHLRAKPGPAAR